MWKNLDFWVIRGLGVGALLGEPWLRHWNPQVDWASRELCFRDGTTWKAIGGSLKNAITSKSSVFREWQQLARKSRKPVKQIIPDWLNEFADVFPRARGCKRLSWSSAQDHITGGGERVTGKVPYRLGEAEQKLLQEKIEKFLAQGWIRPSQSEWATVCYYCAKER